MRCCFFFFFSRKSYYLEYSSFRFFFFLSLSFLSSFCFYANTPDRMRCRWIVGKRQRNDSRVRCRHFLKFDKQAEDAESERNNRYQESKCSLISKSYAGSILVWDCENCVCLEIYTLRQFLISTYNKKRSKPIDMYAIELKVLSSFWKNAQKTYTHAHTQAHDTRQFYNQNGLRK